MKFDVVKKGYDKTQVEEYIQKITQENDEVVTEQKVAIEQLKQENEILVQKVEEYESKKDEIFVAFVEAQDTSAKLKRKAEQRFEQEMERLKLFQQKWTSYAKDIVKTLSQDQMEKFEEMSKKFDEVLSLYAQDVQLVSPEKSNVKKFVDDKSFEPLKKVEKFLDKFEDLSENPIISQNGEVQIKVDEQIEEIKEDFKSADNIEEIAEEKEVEIAEKPIEIEVLAQELLPQQDDEQIQPVLTKEENIQEQVEKVFEEDGHPDDGLEILDDIPDVLDITQSEIYKVQQSLEDLCKELGLVDDK